MGVAGLKSCIHVAGILHYYNNVFWWYPSVYDHAKFKNKCIICNSIMWFIFLPAEKNNGLEIAWEHVQYIYVNKND